MIDQEPRTILRLSATERAFIVAALSETAEVHMLDEDEQLLAAQLIARMT